MEKLTNGPVDPGTTFLARWKGAPSALEVRCVEFEPPRRWVHVNGGPVAVTFTGRVVARHLLTSGPRARRRGGRSGHRSAACDASKMTT
jgi:hypothetical protein